MALHHCSPQLPNICGRHFSVALGHFSYCPWIFFSCIICVGPRHKWQQTPCHAFLSCSGVWDQHGEDPMKITSGWERLRLTRGLGTSRVMAQHGLSDLQEQPGLCLPGSAAHLALLAIYMAMATKAMAKEATDPVASPSTVFPIGFSLTPVAPCALTLASLCPYKKVFPNSCGFVFILFIQVPHILSGPSELWI